MMAHTETKQADLQVSFRVLNKNISKDKDSNTETELNNSHVYTDSSSDVLGPSSSK